MKKRLSAALLAMVLFLGSCANGTEGEAAPGEALPASDVPSAEAPAETEAPDSIEARKLVSDNLPEKDFGGRSFRVLTYNFCTADFVSEEITGALINDAVYNRNATVSERFDIVIETDGGRRFLRSRFRTHDRYREPRHFPSLPGLERF